MSRFPKSRADALSDGVFAFAMTLLVLDIRLPDDLPVSSAAELTAHLAQLSHPMLTYLISFFVLGGFWRGGVEQRPSVEAVSGLMVSLTLLLLLFVTLVPFSSGVVARYGGFAPAIFVYAANMVGLAVLTIALRFLDVAPERRSLKAAAGVQLPLLIASAALSAGMSLYEPRYAMYAYLINLFHHMPFWKSADFPGSNGGSTA